MSKICIKNYLKITRHGMKNDNNHYALLFYLILQFLRRP